MPVLYRPAPSLRRAAKLLTSTLRGNSNTATAQDLVCAHIRLGDIVADCRKYAEESQQPTSRAWVRSHFKNGYSCHQPPEQLAANLKASLEHAGAPHHPPALYAAVEDASTLLHPQLTPFNISSLATLMAHTTVGPQVRALLAGLPSGLRDVLLDQLICASAEHLVLNVFSTFSQTIQTRIGLDHPEVVGWTRDLNQRARARLHLSVTYWRKLDLAHATSTTLSATA